MRIPSLSVEPKGARVPYFAAKKVENYPQYEKKEGMIKKGAKTLLPVALMTASAVAGAFIGVAIYSKRHNLLFDFEKLKISVEKSLESAKKELSKADKKTWAALLALAGVGGYQTGKLSKDDKDKVIETLQHGQSPIQLNAYEPVKKGIVQPPLSYKYSADFYGLGLLKQNGIQNRNTNKYNKAIENIENIGYEKLTSTAPLAPIDKEHPVIWSITSEFAPIKEGGLGNVPVEIRNNVVKLGIEIPTFVPMYLNSGVSSINNSNGEITYQYKGKKFPLEKLASFKMDVYKDSKPSVIPVEFYLSQDGDRQLVFVKCDEYFDGSIYEANSKTEEPEKFAVMSKAIYEFAKLKMDGINANKDVQIYSAYDKVNKPDALILNDWQASPFAALARYKALMENAHGQLSDKTAHELKDMRIITLGHNVTYQGSTLYNNDEAQRKSSTSNILNTLFDNYTFDIVAHAKSGTDMINPDDWGLNNLANVLVMNYSNPQENHTNLLNMGIVLSDYFHPVSQNYANELTSSEHPELSNSLQWALVQKAKAGKLKGIINGNDFNNISIEAKEHAIENATGINFETYSKSTDKNALKTARLHNKINFYRDFILPFTNSKSSNVKDIEKVRKIASGLEFIPGSQGTDLENLSDYEIQNTPILMSGGRLVSQKGIGVMCDAIKILFDNWEQDFGDRPKPIFYIAGSDGEGGSQRAIIENLKNERLSKEDNDRIVFGHGFLPLTAFMAASDYFLMPSLFEPCGLTQGESLAVATPVIASAVGGIVDTINRDGKENGVLTDKEKPLDANEFYLAMKEGLDIFFNDKQRYNNMVVDSLKEDYSWIQEGGKGPVYDYLNVLGINA